MNNHTWCKSLAGSLRARPILVRRARLPAVAEKLASTAAVTGAGLQCGQCEGIAWLRDKAVTPWDSNPGGATAYPQQDDFVGSAPDLRVT